jgi:hypothetical protein
VIRALVDIEARNMRGNLELLALVGGNLEVEQVTLLPKVVRRRVPC